MQVNAISSQNFGHKGCKHEHNLFSDSEAFASLDKADLMKLSYDMAGKQVNDKKHKRIDNALYYGLPLAGGLSAVATLSKASRFGKLATFATSALNWGAGLLAINAFFGLKNKVVNSSEKLRNFEAQHPIASTLGAIGACIGAVALGTKGLSKLSAKYAPKFEAKYGKMIASKSAPILEKIAKTLDNSKILNKMAEVGTKVPSAIKSAGKFLAVNAPLVLLFTNIAHSVNHRNVKNEVASKDYATLSAVQTAVREQLDEENEFLDSPIL
jgi:hypothetical protein